MRWSDQVSWLLAGTAPRRIGWGPGPVTAFRQGRHRLARRPVRLALLEHPHASTRFAGAQAFWINQRSRVCSAAVNPAGRADVAWVFSQDPLPASAQDWLHAELDRLSPAAVVNPVSAYDAYHRDDAFLRLARAGVEVPRTRFGPRDVGRTPVVYKAQWQQPATKHLELYRGELPGFRAFTYVDSRGDDGLARRYRAFWFCGRVWGKDVFLSRDWQVSAASAARVEHAFELTATEREQIAKVAGALGLDFFAVDFVRRREDGRAVFVDVNVYPTVVATAGNQERRERGQWHVWDTRRRLGLGGPGDDVWRELDDVLLELAGAGG